LIGALKAIIFANKKKKKYKFCIILNYNFRTYLSDLKSYFVVYRGRPGG